MAGSVFSKLTKSIITNTTNIAQPLVDQVTAASAVVGASPSVTAGKPSAFLGQENADFLTTQIIYTLPSGALALPRGGTDWICGMWCNTGSMLMANASEFLLSRGGVFGTGSSDRLIILNGRGVTGGMTFGMVIKNSTIAWMANPSPTLESATPVEPDSPYFLMLGQLGNRPYFGYCAAGRTNARIQDIVVRTFTGDINHGYGTFLVGGKVAATYTMVRSGNTITLTRASGGHGLFVGSSVYLTADESTVNGIYTIATVPNSTTFTVAAPGADQTFTNPGYASAGSPGNLFNVVGGGETGFNGNNSCWGGAVSDLFFRTGTPGVTGSMTSALLSGGLLNPTVLADLANRRMAISSLPGTDAYSHNLGDLTLPGTGTISTAAPTVTGSPKKGVVIRQPEYIRVNHRPHEYPHATALGKRTGSIRLKGTTTVGIRNLYATVYSDAAMTTTLLPKHIVAYPSVDGTFEAITKELPIGCDYWVKLEHSENGGIHVISGPHAIGPVYGVISQSTLHVLFGTSSGVVLPPVATTTGIFSTVDISGDLTDSPVVNYTNQASWCRATARRVRYAGQVGDGIVAAANKFLTLMNTAMGTKVPVAFANFCTTGHSADSYIHDRKTRKVSIGTLIAGTAATGTWRPVVAPYWSGGTNALFTKIASAKLYVNKALVATTDDAGNWVGGGVSGSFTRTTGAYSVTCAFAGAAEIEATVYFNTTAGAMTQKTDTTLTCFGDETSVAVTGHVLERILAAKEWGGVTALVYSWENFRVTPVSTMTDTDVELNTAYLMTQIRDRFNKVLGASPPFVVMGDTRSTAFNDVAQYRVRKYTRAWALAQGGSVYYIPGANTATLSAAVGTNAGSAVDGGQHVGEVMAHGLAYLEGLIGAAGEEIVPYAVERVDSSTVDIYVSRSIAFPNATLVTGLGGEPEGVYFGSTTTNLLRIDAAATSSTSEYLGNYTVSFPAGTTNVVRVKNEGGTITSGYWNINYGCPFMKSTNSLTTTTAQATVMNNSIFLNTGGFTAPARPGISVQPAYDSIYCA